MITEKIITDLVSKKLEGTSLFLVDVKVKPGNFIYVFIDSDNNVTIEDCATISRYLESSLKKETEDFELQVSSAGLGQPLKLIRQYKKNIGRNIKIKTIENTYITGKLFLADDEKICIQIVPDSKKKHVQSEIFLKYTEIKEAKTIIQIK